MYGREKRLEHRAERREAVRAFVLGVGFVVGCDCDEQRHDTRSVGVPSAARAAQCPALRVLWRRLK